MSLEIQIQKLTEYLNENNIEINLNSLKILLDAQRITVKMTNDQIISSYLIFECNDQENIKNRRDIMYKKLLSGEQLFDGYFIIEGSKEYFAFDEKKINKQIDIKKVVEEINYNSSTSTENDTKREPHDINNDLIDYTNIFKNKIYLKLKSPLSKTRQLKELLFSVRKIIPNVCFEGFCIPDEMLENTDLSHLNSDFIQILNNQTGNFKYDVIRTSNNRFVLLTNDINFIITKFNFKYQMISDNFPLCNPINSINFKTQFYKNHDIPKTHIIKTIEAKPIKILIQSNESFPLPIMFYKRNLSKISTNLTRKYINMFVKQHGLSEYINQIFIDLYVLYHPEFPNSAILNFLNYTLKPIEKNIFNIKTGKFCSESKCFLENNISTNQIKKAYDISFIILTDGENCEILFPFNLLILPIIKSHIKNLTKIYKTRIFNTFQILAPHYNSFDFVLSEIYIEKAFRIKTISKRFICNVSFILKFIDFALILITKKKILIKFHDKKDTSDEIKKSIVLEAVMQFGYEYILCNQEIGCLFK